MITDRCPPPDDYEPTESEDSASMTLLFARCIDGLAMLASLTQGGVASEQGDKIWQMCRDLARMSRAHQDDRSDAEPQRASKRVST